MSIRDRDGNVYKLRGPNPAMRDQSQWETDRAKFINMNFGKTTEVVADERNPVKKFKTDYSVLDVGEELGLINNEEFEFNVAKIPNKPKEQDLEQIVIRKIEIEPVQEDDIVVETSSIPEEKQPIEISLNEQMARRLKSKMIEFHYAPAIQRMRIDPLYGTSYKITSYGQKDVFDGIVVDQNDLEIQFWAIRPISIGSVVFPKNADRRWWRVDEVEPKTGGFLCKATISDVNPDFS